MDNLPASLDWSLVQAFLAVAETGSLSAAARRLGASQPTLGRQIRQMEDQLGIDLFHRQPRGLTLTDHGLALIGPAKAMREAAGQIALTAAGQSDRLEGTVRITASIVMSFLQLPPILANIRQVEPQIELELVPSDETTSLLYREADIAVRMYRPTQLDLVTRHLGDLRLTMMAARSYLDRRGRPAGARDLARHDLVGFDRSPQLEDGFRASGIPVTHEMFKTRCDDSIAYVRLIQAGCGIGVGQAALLQMDPTLEEVDVGIVLPILPVWLTAHEVMRQTPRIRRVWDLLTERLLPLVD